MRIAGKWNSKFDANKVDMAKVAQSLEGITKQLNASIEIGTSSAVEGATGAAKYAVDVVGKATAKIAPEKEIKLAGQFDEL